MCPEIGDSNVEDVYDDDPTFGLFAQLADLELEWRVGTRDWVNTEREMGSVVKEFITEHMNLTRHPQTSLCSISSLV